MQPSILFQKLAQRAHGVPAAAEQAAEVAGSTSPAVRAAAADAVAGHACDHYTRRPGIAPLCKAVAQRLAAQGLPLHENDVVISGSVHEARYVALRSLGAGKTVYVAAPAVAPYAAALAFAGAAVVHLVDGEPLPSHAAGLLLVAGVPAQAGELAAWAADHDLSVVADTTGSPANAALFGALPDMASRTLTVGNFGSSSGLAAWQVSWFGGPKHLLTPVRDLKQSITICTTAPSQYAALATAQENA